MAIQKEGKIIIGGSGRAGTTFLMMLFTRLGFETGLKPGNEPINKDFYRQTLGSCEISPTEITEELHDQLPRVLKSPLMGFYLRHMLEKGLKVDYAILPVRELGSATRSRISVGLNWNMFNDQIDLRPPYDFIFEQMMSAAALGSFFEACLLGGIPVTLLVFPDYIEKPDELYTALKPIIKNKVTKKQFMEVVTKLSKEVQAAKRRLDKEGRPYDPRPKMEAVVAN